MRFSWVWLFCFLAGCAAPTAEVETGGFQDLENLSYEKKLQAADSASSARIKVIDPSFGSGPPQENAPGGRYASPTQDAPAQPNRQVIYSAGLRVVVVSQADATRSIQSFAEQAGGYLQESDSGSITIRVPADKFEKTLERIASLGEVVDRSVKAADVTEEMLDLNIRLDNARKTRDRLLEHLAKSDKVEDTIKIEAELSRVSGEIERMEGKLRYMQSQIAMSTIRVDLNVLAPRTPGSNGNLDLPFDWIERLGDGLVAGNVKSMPRKPSFFSGGPKFDPPKDFIRYFSKDTLVEAMSADGLRLKLQKQLNYDKGALAFWSKLARKALVESRALAVGTERELGEDRAMISGTREVAGVQYGYLLVLARTKDHVYSFEAWGPKPVFDAQFEALVASAKSLQR